MSKHTIGAWLGMLGRLVSAAGNRDASVWDQAEQVSEAHTELFNELRRMDALQAELLDALIDIADDYSERFDMESPSTNPGMKIVVQNARAAIAKARGEA